MTELHVMVSVSVNDVSS